MPNIRHGALWQFALIVVLSATPPSSCGAQSSPSDQCDGRIALWDFAAPNLSSDRRQNFKSAVCKEIANLENWAAKANWLTPFDRADCDVHDSSLSLCASRVSLRTVEMTA